MQGSYFFSRINVERTGEQYYLDQCNSQKRRMMSYGTGTQVEAQMINKCRAIIIGRMLCMVGKDVKTKVGGEEKTEENCNGKR